MATKKADSYLSWIRRSFQLAVVAAAAYTGIRLAMGLALTSVEKYCPMGGLATTYSLFNNARFSCATGEFNFSLAVALLLSAVLLRKAFCSWLCPVGTVSELVGKAAAWISRKAGGPRKAMDVGLAAPATKTDRPLRWLRLPVLLAVLWATFASGELLFRPFCPYYVMFSFHGHDVQMYSYGLLALFVAGIIVLPMIWCRYLCPLGGVLWPLSRAGLLRVQRNDGPCIDCGKCDLACAQSLDISGTEAVRSGECTLCLQCTSACPTPGALELRTSVGRSKGRVPGWVVPLAVVAFTALGLFGGRLVVLPSYATQYVSQPGSAASATVTFKVAGMHCVDTAKLAATVFEGWNGVISFTAYGSRNEVVLEYDANTIDQDMLRRIMDGPVLDKSTQQYIFHVFKVIEIDGRKTAELPKGP